MSTPNTTTTTSSEASGSASSRIKQDIPPSAASKEEGNASEAVSEENSSSTVAAAAAIAPKNEDDSNVGALSEGECNGGIITPHDHDVLSGRGNSVNHHPGNEYFRSLVRHHKLAYVRCPKPQKEQFSKLIVSTIRDREPSGRFLKQNSSSKVWYNIGTQKALDKTRQALREGAPATVAGLMLSQGLTPSAAAAAGLTPSQAVSTLSGVSGENDLINTPGSATANGASNPFLTHHQAQQHAAHAHHAAAVAANHQQQAQQQHHNAMAVAAHSRMVQYNAAAAAAAAGIPNNYPNSPKPPTSSGTTKDGVTSSETPSANNSTSKNGPPPPPQSPNTSNPRLPPPVSTPSYPPIPPSVNSDEGMKFHTSQVVRMATAAHAATGNGGTSGAAAGGNSASFGSAATLAAAAGTFNPVLLEHIMAQHRSGSAPPPGSAASAMDWNGGRQQAASSGGRGDYHYPGYPPAPGAPQHEDIHTKCQRQEAYISHLQERIQQQERQLLTLCSHILLSPPNAPTGGNMVNSSNNVPPPSIPSNNNAIPGSAIPSNPGVSGGSPLHNGISHPQFAAAAKMNAATAVANINATAAAVKELKCYASNGGDNGVADPRSLQHAAAVAVAVQSKASNPPASSPSAQSSSSSSSKPQKITPANGHSSKEKSSNTSAKSTSAAEKSPPPTPGKSTDDGDAVAALLALGIGKSPTSSSPTAAETPTAASSETSDESSATKKKRKHSASGRRTLPLKKKQNQQEESGKEAAAVAAATAAAVATNSAVYHQLPPAQQQHLSQHQLLHHAQPQVPQRQQLQQPKSITMNSLLMQNNRAIIAKPPIDMGPSPELYLYGETPIHDPHVHDVLCGRGALTNEHPGNEWFRRLVRSNRQLYRSCPKHTKLLVAKAIVQAVQRTQRNPPGRFLEKTKTSDGSMSNSWTPITYKSAVEKASQALREKVTPNWGAPPSNFPLSKALEAARAVAYLEKEYPSGDGFGGTNLLALIMAVVQSAGLD